MRQDMLEQLNEQIDLAEGHRAQFAPGPGEARLSAERAHNVPSRFNTPGKRQTYIEGVKLIRDVFAGNRSSRVMVEAMSTSDFPLIFGDVIDRLAVQDYRADESPWRRFLKVGSVPDFRDAKRFRIYGGDNNLSEVNQLENYPEDAVDESKMEISVSKYGRMFKLGWEVFVNDDLDVMRDFPRRLARAALRTEQRFASSLYVANGTLYSGGNGNKGTDPLDVAALKSAFQTMANFKSPDGEPIMNTPRYLVVPRVLEIEAREMVGSMQLVYSGGDASTDAAAVAYPTRNVLAGKLEVLVDPWIDVLDSSNGTTSWYLFADPSEGHAAEVAFLRGWEEPQIYQRVANATRLGGSDGLPIHFDDDSLAFKVRHIVGGLHANALGNWRFTYWSDGSGS